MIDNNNSTNNNNDRKVGPWTCVCEQIYYTNYCTITV